MDIYTLGEDVLRKKTAAVADIDQGIVDFTQAMIETMHEGNGIGLAAPQVGDLQRIFVVHIPQDKPRVFINPEIVATSIEESFYEEGCLSIPDVYSEIKRASGITVQAWNEKGRLFRLDADGLLARVVLHENDHLSGILFIDKLPQKKRERLVKSYQKNRSGISA
ncbi:MAG: peptide deformylase [Spirochaetales bacterium]|nr:peptide deformylase [Spirochaetales bacterium]MCF7937584.1 peptide deformylase [Spirochaetales bacterium]